MTAGAPKHRPFLRRQESRREGEARGYGNVRFRTTGIRLRLLYVDVSAA